ncbi:hypothetical protein [Chryseobacterium sp. HR92]|uniref:hypothetical protein n=1 Tax=Chryseobacterium sp. HR92 TaxID=3094839 RepID=UPI00388E5A3D|nr:hypothetical protein SFA27_07710 [Chryseobacterium sp. HR92]
MTREETEDISVSGSGHLGKRCRLFLKAVQAVWKIIPDTYPSVRRLFESAFSLCI